MSTAKSIVVNTPNSTIGRQLSRRILDAGVPLTVIARDPAKVADLAERGARVVVGSIDDAAALRDAFTGARAVFWLTPPPVRPDFLEWAHKVAEQAASIAAEAGVTSAVVLSSVGAHSGPGIGPVGVLLGVEGAWRRKIPSVTALRAGFFFENFFRDAQTITGMGKIFSPAPADKKFPMVATADIAESAANALLNPPSGHQDLGVHGPEDLTYAEATARLSEAMGRTIDFVQIGLEDLRAALGQMGLPEFLSGAYVDMYAGILDGRMDAAEPRSAATTTRTPIGRFFRDVFVPRVNGASE
ncbi:MAG: NAD(P)H-binding protein [Nannocystaceae bacterium]